MIHMRDFNAFEARNVKFLVNKQIEYATIQITETGFRKSILDATAPVRAYFLRKESTITKSNHRGQITRSLLIPVS